MMLGYKINCIRMTNLSIGANHVDPESTLFVRDSTKGFSRGKKRASVKIGFLGLK